MLEIKDIKKGDEFWECEYGENVHYVALSDAWHDETGWTVQGLNDQGHSIRFFVNDQYQAYAPKLYSYPAYL